MNPLDDQERRDAQDAEERRTARLRAAQFRSDVQAVLAEPAGRRVLWAFLCESGADVSPLRADNLTTGHAIGWQDAAGWWVNAMRAHCPEREAQMRAEARKDLKQEASDD
jgi:hypothetical protein